MTIQTTPDGIEILLHGSEQIWALRAKVCIPFETITSIEYAEKWQDWRKWEVRIPGTGAPGILLAGSYWTEEGWDFLYIKKPRGLHRPLAENVLVITTNQTRYRRIIVSCSGEDAQRVLAKTRKG